MPASPRPLGSGAKYKKRITNTEWGGGLGKSINCVGQGQAPLIGSHSQPEFSKVQIVKICNPSGLLTKIKSHIPNKPRVERQLEGQQQSEKRQVEMVREKTGRRRRRKGRDGPERDSKRQAEETGCLEVSRSSVSHSMAWLWGPM